MKIRITFQEELLGTANANPEIHKEFIASKAPDAKGIEEEVESLGVENVVAKATTIFPKEDGQPFLWDYQWKGYFKEACSMLARVPKTESSKIKAFKKIIDGLIFVHPRRIFITLPEGQKIGYCQRPLRGQTAQGERISLANSETIPAGSMIEFEIQMLDDKYEKAVKEWLEYGALHGTGQWRNSGKGRFAYEIL